MKEVLDLMAEITGWRHRRCVCPIGSRYARTREQFLSQVTGKPPRVPLAGVRMAGFKMFFNPAKAIRELGRKRRRNRRWLMRSRVPEEWVNQNRAQRRQ
jgi:dihydroflavonol-4-reductase